MISFPLSLLYIASALLLFFVPWSLRKRVACILSTYGFVAMLFNLSQPHEFQLFFNIDSFSFHSITAIKTQKVFTFMFSLVAVLASFYLPRLRANHEHAFTFFYVGAGLGVLQSADLLTFFLFWECLTLGGCLLIAESNQPGAKAASFRYLLFHVFGGLLFFLALALMYVQTGTLMLRTFDLQTSYGALLFLAVGVNVAFPLLHSWLVDSYPKASAGGAAVLSAITTKTAVFAMITFFSGEVLLILIGIVMAYIPLWYAWHAKDVRELLAYSLMNPLGFMLCGIGVGTSQALLATKAHVFSHIAYKSSLFMLVGLFLHMYGSVKVSALASMRAHSTLFKLGIFIALLVVFPGSAAYVSKGVLLDEVARYPLAAYLLYGSGFVLFLVCSVRFIDFLFFGEGDIEPASPPFSMLFALLVFTCIAFLPGVFPSLFSYVLISPELSYGNLFKLSKVATYTGIFFALASVYIMLRKKALFSRESSFETSDSMSLYAAGVRKVRDMLARIAALFNEQSELFALARIKGFSHLNVHEMAVISSMAGLLAVFVFLALIY